MQTSSADAASPKSSTEIDVLAMLRRRWFHLASGTGVGIALGLLFFYATTPMYESKVEILVGQRSSELATSGSMSNSQASGDVVHEDVLATHMQLFSSRTLVSNAIRLGDLEHIQSVSAAKNRGADPVDWVIEHLEVTHGGTGAAKNAMVLSAKYRDQDATDAARVLSALYKSYEDYVQTHSQSTSREAAELIEEARIENERELVAADAEYRQYIQSVPVLLEGEQVRDVHKTRLEQIERELNDVRSSLAEAKSRLNVIGKFVGEHGVTGDDLDKLALLSEKDVTRLKLFLDMTRGEAQSDAFQADQPARVEAAKAQYSRLLDLLQKERTLHDVYGASHPMIEATRQEIEVIQRFVASNTPETAVKRQQLDPKAMLATFTRLLKNDVAEYEIRERLLVETSKQEMKLAKEVENAFLEGTAKKAKLVRAQTRYDEVIRRSQELNLAGSYAGFSTDLLATPEPAPSPAWPKLPIVVALAAILGFLAGSASGLAAEVLDTTFRDSEDVERTMGAPALAHVPLFDFKKMDFITDDSSKLAPSLIAAHCPRSPEAEVYRVARTALMVRTAESQTRVVMMSSPHPGDGKSTTISNLAISFAQAGKRVLLIDADLRRPVISNLFGIPDREGLSDVLLGHQQLSSVITGSEVPKLDLLTHGTDSATPAELLQSNRMGLMLQTLRKHYDLVLIDAPPVLAVADPAIIAPQADAVLLTIRVTKNGRRPVELARRILLDNGVSPLALIVNGVTSGSGVSYGYGGYGSEAYVGQYHSQYAARVDSETINATRPKAAPISTYVPKPTMPAVNVLQSGQADITDMNFVEH